MLFNSYAFIFVFLPIAFGGFFRIGKHSHALASLWLAAASLFFYGWWDVRFLGLLICSIVFNYGAGYLIGHSVARQSGIQSKILFLGAITANLILLGYFKYANFFVSNINLLAESSFSIDKIILPLGISFFTFTQIAFLVDTYQGKVKEYNFVHYMLFVSYFPHLIAGPVLHHQEMMPQFGKRNVCHINWNNVSVGLSIFVLGLLKKVLIADSLANLATPFFGSVAAGDPPMLIESWVGALAYALQLYFDFSAYSEMAIGLSLMFNVRLPLNFNSPYKSTNIIEFWRRWHMTLSRFLRDYLYIPLGGNRNGKGQRYFNLMITMLLGGLWHGAGWTFVIWGGLHGVYLLVNHAWRGFKLRMGWSDGGRLAKFCAGALTFIAVVIAWVFFRADSYSSAMAVLHGMFGANGLMQKWVPIREDLKLVVPCLICIFFFPNVRQLFQHCSPVCEDMKANPLAAEQPASAKPGGRLLRLLHWRPTKAQAMSYGIIFSMIIIFMHTAEKSEFIYFQF